MQQYVVTKEQLLDLAKDVYLRAGFDALKIRLDGGDIIEARNNTVSKSVDDAVKYLVEQKEENKNLKAGQAVQVISLPKHLDELCDPLILNSPGKILWFDNNREYKICVSLMGFASQYWFNSEHLKEI